NFRFGEAVVDLDTAKALQFQLESGRQISDKGDLSAYWRDISFEEGFLGTPPSYTLIRGPMLRLCHRLIACSVAGRSEAPEKVTVTYLFYLKGMDVGSLNIPYLLARPERQPDAVASTPEAAEDALAVDEGAPADQAPMQVARGCPIRDAPGVELAMPVPPQPSRTNNQTHDPSTPYLFVSIFCTFILFVS
nr:hypothetical protein [Tanacetum cinerariifolium]